MVGAHRWVDTQSGTARIGCMGVSSEVLRWLGLEQPPDTPGVVDTVASVLAHLDPRRARYLAAFAYLLGRVADADHAISAEERDLMLRLVAMEGSLSPQDAAAVVTLALDEFRRVGGTDNVLVAREFAAVATFEERLGLLRCLFAVSAADESVIVSEDNEIRRISRELKIEHADFIHARAQVREHLAVLRRAP
jgi:uncharacterized tellurite resistance protein B-like protein